MFLDVRRGLGRGGKVREGYGGGKVREGYGGKVREAQGAGKVREGRSLDPRRNRGRRRSELIGNLRKTKCSSTVLAAHPAPSNFSNFLNISRTSSLTVLVLITSLAISASTVIATILEK